MDKERVEEIREYINGDHRIVYRDTVEFLLECIDELMEKREIKKRRIKFEPELLD